MAMKDWIESFRWKSQDQKEGFLSLVKDLRDGKPGRQIEIPQDLAEVFAWFIQKDHESNLWWDERVSALAKHLEERVNALMLENRDLRGELQRLKSKLVRNVSSG